MLEDFRLRVFSTAVSCGSFTRAAAQLGISQPAVSQNISELEKSLGKVLLERSRSGIVLTEEGKIFLRYCNRILFWYESAQKAVAGQQEDSSIVPVTLADGREVEVCTTPDGLNIKLL